MRGCILEIKPEGLSKLLIDTMLVYHFGDPDLGIEIFFEK